MKIAYFEIMAELENVLESKIIQQLSQEYSLLINPEKDDLKKLEQGIISYESIEIYLGNRKITLSNNKEEFESIIKVLEEEETINEIFKKLKYNKELHSPDSFKQDIDIHKSFSNLKKNYAIIPVFLLLVFAIINLIK